MTRRSSRARAAFLEGHRYAKAGTEDLRSAFEAASGLDLKPYFDRWVYDTGLPAVTWTSSSERRRGRLPHHRRAAAEPLPRPAADPGRRGHERRHRATRRFGSGPRMPRSTDRHARGAAAGRDQRGPGAARADRASREPGSAIAVATALFLERRDAALDLGELLLVLVLEGDPRGPARVVEAAARVVELELELVDDVLVDGLFLARLVEALAPVGLRLDARLARRPSRRRSGLPRPWPRPRRRASRPPRRRRPSPAAPGSPTPAPSTGRCRLRCRPSPAWPAWPFSSPSPGSRRRRGPGRMPPRPAATRRL